MRQILITFEDGTLGMIEVSRNACDIYDVRTEVIELKLSEYWTGSIHLCCSEW